MLTHVVFARGDHGFHTYRIPALVVTPRGTVLAFAEARKHHASDTGEIAIVMRRSTDQGVSFESQRVIIHEAHTTCGNPAPVVNERDGTIWLAFCKNNEDGPERAIFEGKAPRTVWLMRSEDDGVSWSVAWEITAQVKRKDFTWYATGPGHGIQLRSGRLLLPCDHTQAVKYEHTDPVRSHVIYSDDGGRSWQLGGIISAPNSSECGLVELAPDRVLLEFRHDTERHTRGFAISQDGGLSFGAPHFVVQPDPGCGGGVTDVNGEVWISHLSHASQRENLVIRASRDLQHFPELHSVWRGPAAYSELIATRDVVLCLFEAGEQHPYETIRVARLPLNGN